jgi:uncharacterized protein (TIRG00374 family)
LLTVGKYVLGIGLLAALVWRYRHEFQEALGKPIQFGPLALAAAATLCGVSLTMIRWHLLVRAQDLPFALRDAFRLGLIGYFFSLFLPGSIGGDVVKATFLAREQKRRTVAAATALMDRAIGLWGLICVVAMAGCVAWLWGNAAITANRFLQSAVIATSLVVAVTILAWACLGILSEESSQRFADWLERLPKVGVAVAELWRAGWMYRRRQLSVGVAILISLLSHSFFTTAFFFAGQVFQDPAHPTPTPALAEHFVFFPIGETCQVFSFTPGGAGLAEWVYGLLYKEAGASEATGTFVAFVYRILMSSWAVIGYFVAIRMRSSFQPVEQPATELVMAEV